MSEKPPPYSNDPYGAGMTYSSMGAAPPPPYGAAPGGPAGGAPGGQLGWGVPPPQYTQQGSVHVVSQQPTMVRQPVLVQGIGTCPSCRAGVLRHQFTCPGILLCFCFFPIGIVCLFALMERRCTHCYTSFG